MFPKEWRNFLVSFTLVLPLFVLVQKIARLVTILEHLPGEVSDVT